MPKKYGRSAHVLLCLYTRLGQPFIDCHRALVGFAAALSLLQR
jgi:hypothetical protein